MVEHGFRKAGVEGSNPFFGFSTAAEFLLAATSQRAYLAGCRPVKDVPIMRRLLVLLVVVVGAVPAKAGMTDSHP